MTAADDATPVDLDWCTVDCPQCARSFPGVTALEAHSVATHGHPVGDTAT